MGLVKLALELARKLSSGQAVVVLLVLVAGLLLVQVAAMDSPGPAIWGVIAILIIGQVAALALHYIDRSAPAKGLTDEDRKDVCRILEEMREEVADELDMDKAYCRANVFGKISAGQRLQIVDHLMANMDTVKEWDISIPIGRGASGIAWETGEPNVVLLPSNGNEDLSPEEASRVDPDLRWIISVPVQVDGSPKWVVNVDCKEAHTRDQLQPVVQVMQRAASRLRPFAEKA